MWILLGGGVNTNQPVAERHRRHFILSCTAASIMAVISFFSFYYESRESVQRRGTVTDFRTTTSKYIITYDMMYKMYPKGFFKNLDSSGT